MTRAGRFATRFGLAIGIWTLAFMAGIVLQGCDSGSGSVTGPTSTPTSSTPVAAAPAPAPTATPTAVADPTSPTSFEGRILPNGGWTVKNMATTPSRFTAYYTSFDNQSLPLGSKPPVIRNPGDTYEDTFNLQCVQVDLTYGNPGDAPFLFGYIDAGGNVLKAITSTTRYDCAPRDCKLSEWRYGSWGEWYVSRDGLTRTRTRTNTRVVTDPAYRGGKACGPLTEEQSETEKCRPGSELVLTADKNDPRDGNSFFKYYVFKKKPGLFNDELIFSENLPKGAVRRIPTPADGATYYVQYDGEVFNRDYADAKCADLKAAWHPTLDFNCFCTFPNQQ